MWKLGPPCTLLTKTLAQIILHPMSHSSENTADWHTVYHFEGLQPKPPSSHPVSHSCEVTAEWHNRCTIPSDMAADAWLGIVHPYTIRTKPQQPRPIRAALTCQRGSLND